MRRLDKPQSNAQIATHIAVLTRVFDVNPQLGHQLRVAAYSGRFSREQAAAVIAMLRQLPPHKGTRRA